MERDAVVDIAIECLLTQAGDRNHEEWHHCRRVEMFCTLTARELGWAEEEIDDLRLAALLHHMDRSRIPESALAPRVASYLRAFDRHASGRGAQAKTSKASRPAVAASIIALGDRFDQLLSGRRGRSLSQDSAVEILKCAAGKAFDAAMVEAFCRAYGEGLITVHPGA